MQNPSPYEPQPASPEAPAAPVASPGPSFVSYPEPPSPPPPPPPPAFQPMPGSGMYGTGMQTSIPAPRKRSRIGLPAGAVAAVVGGFLLFRILTAASVSVPDEIDSVSRVSTGPLATQTDKAIQQSGLNDYDAVGGLYGTQDAPEFLFIAAKGTETAEDDRQALQSTSDGLSSGGGPGLDLTQITTEERDGVSYNCAPMTARGITGAGCLWNDGKTLGAVLWFSDRGAPVDFAVVVHDAVVS